MINHLSSIKVTGNIDVAFGFNYLVNGSTIDANYVGAVARSLYSAKGVIVVGQSASSPSALTVGSNGTFLIADSAQSLGVRWGTLSASDVPNLDAGKIVSGVFDAARIPSLDASKITTGAFSISRGGTGASSYTAGQHLIWHDGNNSFAALLPTETKYGTGAGSPNKWVWTSTGTGDLPAKNTATGWSATGTSSRSPASGMTLAQIIDVVRTLVADLKDVGVLSS